MRTNSGHTVKAHSGYALIRFHRVYPTACRWISFMSVFFKMDHYFMSVSGSKFYERVDHFFLDIRILSTI